MAFLRTRVVETIIVLGGLLSVALFGGGRYKPSGFKVAEHDVAGNSEPV